MSVGYRWFALFSFSLLLFVISATTFTSLGVLLPRMVEELDWTWARAGLGYTLLGLLCGAGSLSPARLIRLLGVPKTLIIGVLFMAAGFLCIFLAKSVWPYWVGAALCGFGYTHVSFIPATHVLGRIFERRAFAIGVYMTVGALGGVAGPAAATLYLSSGLDWRYFWAVAGVATLAAGIICAVSTMGFDAWAAKQSSSNSGRRVANDNKVFRTLRDWSTRDALRSYQFYVLMAAYAAQLLCASSVNGLSVAHLRETGLSAGLAGGLLSLQAFIAAGSKTAAGFIGDRFEPKTLLLGSLTALTVGLVALAIAGGWTTYSLYVLGVGLGYGVTALATTILLINYFGQKNYLEIFSTLCLGGSLAAFGTFIGGSLRDVFGSFEGAFLAFAAVMAIVLVAAALMRPPKHAAAQGQKLRFNWFPLEGTAPVSYVRGRHKNLMEGAQV